MLESLSGQPWDEPVVRWVMGGGTLIEILCPQPMNEYIQDNLYISDRWIKIQLLHHFTMKDNSFSFPKEELTEKKK